MCRLLRRRKENRVKIQLSPAIIGRATVVAKQMLAEEQDLAEFQFGHETGKVFVTSNADRLTDPQPITVEGRTCYVGLFLKR